MYGFASAADTHEYGALVIREDITYKVDGLSRALETRRCSLLVTDERGLPHTSLRIPESEFTKLKSLVARVIDENGRLIRRAGKNDGVRYCGWSSFALFTDDCETNFQLDAPTYPFTISYEYTLEHSTLMFWPQWYPQSSVPVVSSRYTIEIPEEFKLRTKPVARLNAPDSSVADGRRRFAWSASDIPAVRAEECGEQTSDLSPWLRVASENIDLEKHRFRMTSWSAFAADYHKVVDQKLDVQSVNAEAPITDSVSQEDLEGLWRSIHQELQEQLRYVAIEVGAGGWVPFSASETIKLGYGDCKAMAVTYVSLLQAAGVEAHPVLLTTRGGNPPDPDFPQPTFNHVIVMIRNGADTIWTDPTCDVCALGDLPWSDEGMHGLVVADSTPSLVQLPISTAESNGVSRLIRITPIGANEPGIETRLTFTGNAAHRIARAVGGKVGCLSRETLKAEDLSFTDDVVFDSVVSDAPDERRRTLQIHAWGRIRKGINTKDRNYIDLNFAPMMSGCQSSDLSERKYPLSLGYPRVISDSIVVVIPVGWSVKPLSVDTTWAGELGELAMKCRETDTELLIERRLESTVSRIEPDAFDKYAAHRDKVHRHLFPFIVLTRDSDPELR